MERYSKIAWAKGFGQATFALSLIGGICLIGLVAILAVGVVMRYLFGVPILGINEIVQLTAVALVMSALPYATVQRAHVSVDVFDPFIGRIGRLIGDILSRLISGYVLAILTQRAVLKSLDALEWGDATNMLGLPIWPFYAILAAGTALCVLVFAVDIILILTGKGDQK